VRGVTNFVRGIKILSSEEAYSLTLRVAKEPCIDLY
jgi:hypothetical protein